MSTKLSAICICLLIVGCNRAAVRIPGASLSFPDTPTGYVAAKKYSFRLVVMAPADLRQAHYGQPVAGTSWTACRTDATWTDSATTIVRDRLVKELEASGLFQQVLTDASGDDYLVLESELDVFCSEVVGFIFNRVAGMTSIKFTLTRDGNVLWEQQLEKVVTDADHEYTGSQVTFIEQAMRVTTADSLRLVLADLLKQLDLRLVGIRASPQVER